jgi:hypothetical protein
MREIGQNLKTACNAIDVGDNSVTLGIDTNPSSILTKNVHPCFVTITHLIIMFFQKNTANKSASFSYMVREDSSSHKSRDLEPPYVSIYNLTSFSFFLINISFLFN